MIRKYYEISCDLCGCGVHFRGSALSAERQFKSLGGIIINKKHYCDKYCYGAMQGSKILKKKISKNE